MEMTERNKQIYELRKSGMTYRAISQSMNVKVERARQIYIRQQKKEETCSPLKSLLSARLINAFIAPYGDERLLENPQMIIDKFSLKDLKKVQNIGRKSIQELKDAMITLGYVKEGDKWLEE